MSNFFAAIAFSESTSQIGYAWSAPDQASAEQAALQHCPGGDAVILVCVCNGWCALAVGEGGRAWAKGPSAEEVQRAALKECQTIATNCRINVCLHSQHGQCEPAQPSTSVSCPHCNRQLRVKRVDVEQGKTFTCPCQGEFTVNLSPPQEGPKSGDVIHGYKFHGPYSMPDHRQCEWCGRTFDASQGFYNHVIHGWFSTARFGYFCSPRCVREADHNGFGGTPHQ